MHIKGFTPCLLLRILCDALSAVEMLIGRIMTNGELYLHGAKQSLIFKGT